MAASHGFGVRIQASTLSFVQSPTPALRNGDISCGWIGFLRGRKTRKKGALRASYRDDISLNETFFLEGIKLDAHIFLNILKGFSLNSG